MYKYSDVVLKSVPQPALDCTMEPVALTDATISERKNKILSRMEVKGLDALVIYADLEHGSNFEYLVGFLPRFEEALLVLHRDGKAYLVLGNENLNKASKARIEAEAVHAPYFSLPNQPMENTEPFVDILARTDIKGKKVGICGWKNFTSRFEDNGQLYDVPYYIVSAIESLCGKDNITNACSIFIGEHGARNTNNANEIAHYEFGAALSSDCMLGALNALKPGVSEMEIADKLERYGQRPSVVTIASFGPRFIKANMYPTSRKLEIGETVSLTIGYKGGLASRAGYAVEQEGQLPEGVRDYIEKVAAPYFTSIRAWLENIHVGMTGGELYSLMEEVLPREVYGWGLCPGHLTADEEWSSSPIYKGSEEKLQSGMMLQTDIIPSVPGYGGASVESPCLIADETLKEEIQAEYPDMWKRMMDRREYIINVLGIQLNEDVLPTASTLAYMRPFMLSDKALVISGTVNPYDFMLL